MKLFKRRWFWITFITLLVVAAAVGLYAYNRVMNTRVQAGGYFYIKTGDTYEDVLARLTNDGIVTDSTLFDLLANKANYPAHVKPGKYRVTKGQPYIDFIRLLRSGKQEQVKLVINGMITKEKLVSIVGTHLEADSIILYNMLQDSLLLDSFGVTPRTALCFFIPNTYNFYWNTNAREFMERMKKEYNAFWNDERKRKAAAINLTPVQVGILASIVDGETNKVDELSIVAGLYENRLRIGMKLQADPTVKYAHGNPPWMKRVSIADTKIEHPYNTYHVFGLPPGPLALPTYQSIIAVLNPGKHDFLYMCAKEDLSGYHNFAVTAAQHELNASRYRAAMDRLGIR